MKKRCDNCYYYRRNKDYLQQANCSLHEATLVGMSGKKLNCCKQYVNAEEMRKYKEMMK